MSSDAINFYTDPNQYTHQGLNQQSYYGQQNHYNVHQSQGSHYVYPSNQYSQPNQQHSTTEVSWLSALGTRSIGDEPSLLEELEINPQHMQEKTVAVLNPFRTLDSNLVVDADCWGPILFLLLFAASLLLAGKPLFSFIYGVAAIGWIGIYTILNLMSETGIDAQRTISVLGYCLLPMAILSWASIVLPLQ